ncbi:cytochrome P450 [Trichoderma sp. SZMC 28012]
MSNFIIAQGIIVLIGVLVYSLFFRRKRDALLPLPPGPKPLPILGNIRDGPPKGVPDFLHWLTFKDKYGPISSLTVLGQTAVILHDKDAAIELLDKKESLKTSGRPSFAFLRMCGYTQLLPLLQYNDEFRLQRKLLHQQIGTKRLASQYTDIQDVEVKRFLLRLLNDPDNLFNHIRSEAAAVILKVTYGYSIESHKPDALVKLIEAVTEQSGQALLPFRLIVDLIPSLQRLPEWFPGAGFKRQAREAKVNLDASADVPFDFVKEQMTTGTHQESFCSKLIKTFRNGANEMEQDIEDAIRWAAGVLFAGGSDTTVATIMAFILAMIMNPDVQRKAQEEIDRVVGPHRLPTRDDQENLPYVDAIVKESLRYYPVAPMGVAHKTTEEIFFRGYRIPSGSYILPATWWFLHDPKTYAEPSEFAPERFLEPRNEPDPEAVFGHGRRVCPGRYVAQESLYLTISQTLAAFNIGKAMQGGKPVEVECKHTTGVVDHPAKFQYSIVPRSEKYAELIRRVEVDHPWEESSGEAIQGSAVLDKFKADYEASS